MQVLKKDIQDKIINISERLFYEQGFEKTSTRQIANKLNMSVSNLYKYFKNKEDIFEFIIKDYHNNYISNFTRYISHENKDSFNDESNEYLAKAIFESLKNNQIKFVILMDKSKGTKYSTFKDKIISGLEQHIREGITEKNNNEYIIKVFVRNFFYGIIEIAKQNKGNEWTYKNINLLVNYHMKGISILYD